MVRIQSCDAYEHGQSHTLLLQALVEAGSLTAEEAACAEFCEAAGGKPYLKGHPEICFNISHSGNRFACAVGAKEVGIDLERTNRLLKNGEERGREREERVAARAFGHEELRLYGQGLSFYEIWSAKEALVKYTGEGLGGMHSHFVDGGMSSPAGWRQAVAGPGLELTLPDGGHAILRQIEAAQSETDVCFLCTGEWEEVQFAPLNPCR